MDTLHETFALLRFARIRGFARNGDARIEVSLPDGTQLTIVLDGCTELALHAAGEDAAIIDDPAALSALDLQFTGLEVVPEPVTWVFAWKRGSTVLGGRLRVRAAGLRLEDGSGAAVPREELKRRAGAETVRRIQSFKTGDYVRVLDAVLKKDIRPLLARAGFTAARRTFTRPRNDLVDTISIETGRFSTAESLQFNVQLDVQVGGPGDARSAVRRTLEPPWVLAGEIDERLLADRLEDAMNLIVLPFLDRFQSADDAINALVEMDRRNQQHRHSYVIGEILARLGRFDEARRHFLEAEGDRAAIRRAAAAYGITLE